MIVERRENIQRERENKKDLKWVFDIGRKETLKSQNRFFCLWRLTYAYG